MRSGGLSEPVYGLDRLPSLEPGRRLEAIGLRGGPSSRQVATGRAPPYEHDDGHDQGDQEADDGQRHERDHTADELVRFGGELPADTERDARALAGHLVRARLRYVDLEQQLPLRAVHGDDLGAAGWVSLIRGSWPSPTWHCTSVG